jgi:hypothetical protein
MCLPARVRAGAGPAESCWGGAPHGAGGAACGRRQAQRTGCQVGCAHQGQGAGVHGPASGPATKVRKPKVRTHDSRVQGREQGGSEQGSPPHHAYAGALSRQHRQLVRGCAAPCALMGCVSTAAVGVTWLRPWRGTLGRWRPPWQPRGSRRRVAAPVARQAAFSPASPWARARETFGRHWRKALGHQSRASRRRRWKQR